ncbi:MAG: hypothetical protein IJ970_00610, partial [Mycoplasmataceae bacterium]|nr:hypothetical protein [Mycoplasmataceae bacterium]
NQNYISNTLFLGYKYNYLILNINILIKTLKQILILINNITSNNGNILFLYTNNKIINYLLQKNSIYKSTFYLNNFIEKQQNVLTYLDKFPDLVISFDYQTNAIFLNKISTFNTPIICITDLLNTNIITKQMYYLLINNKSLYINIILIYILFNSIKNNKKTLGTQFLEN